MSAAPRVTAIIPTRNGAATLPALLAALTRQQARGGLEIVAIDSASSDATRDLLAGAGATVLDLGGRPFGHGSARNRAAAAARGE
ncbi:MAG: glycosyltransferase, partial [Gemmatimonadales bacterium]|nr:glycosyltransferase [Gemmatimonadales bacterium]